MTVAAVTVLFGSLLACWSVITPTYRAPDELQHVDAAESLRDGEGWPRPGAARIDAAALRTYEVAQALQPLPYGGSGPDARPELDSADRSSVVNQMTQHPPLYYAVASLWLRMTDPGDDAAYDRTVGRLRWLSILLLLPLPALAAATARRLGASDSVAAAAALVPVAVPQLGQLGGVANNDDLLIPLAGAVAYLCARVGTGDTSARTAALVGAATAAALLTKGLALALLPLVLLAYASRRAWRPAVLAASVSCLGLWWWVANLVRYDVVQPAGLPPSGEPLADPSAAAFGRFFAAAMSRRFWGVFGQLEVPLPQVLTWALTVALCALVALGVRRRSDLAQLVVVAGCLLVVGWGAWRAYATTGGTPGIQGRYLYPGVVGIAALAALGAGRVAGQRDRWLPLLSLVAATTLAFVGIGVALGGFWDSLAGLQSWSPWPAWLTWTLLLAPAPATVAAAWALRPRG